MNDPQAQAVTPGTEPQVQPQAVTPANGGDVQPEVQPGAAQQPQAETSVDQSIQGFQRMLDNKRVENYQLQQRLQEMEQRQNELIQRIQPQQNQNPHDYTTNFPEWQRWEMREQARYAAEEANQGLLRQLQGMAMQNSEQQWQANHPQANINEVKAFAKMRWGTNQVSETILNDAYELMTKDYNQNQIRSNIFNSAIDQFRNTNSSATPLRSGQSPPVQAQLSYANDVKAWADSDGRVEQTWSPERRAAFWAETNARKTNPGA